jgi:hypothetical protein
MNHSSIIKDNKLVWLRAEAEGHEAGAEELASLNPQHQNSETPSHLTRPNQQTPPPPLTSTTPSAPLSVCFTTLQLSVPVNSFLSSGGEHGCSGKTQPTCLPNLRQ